MAKKKGVLGKLIAFTTTVAAIGGVCYVFRDKIKESPAFKSATDKANDLYDTVKTKMRKDDDDFFFDDDDFFDDEYDDLTDSDNSTGEREYTTIGAKQADGSSDTTSEEDKTPASDITPENIPTIDLGGISVPDNSESSEADIPTAYENEGLSDVYEDPDVLEDMDKLDN